MKKIVLSIVAIFTFLGALVFFSVYTTFFGNPIDCVTTPNKIEKIIEERYDEDFKVIDKNCQYSVDFEEASVTLQSTKNPDIQFTAYTEDVDVATKDTVDDNYLQALWEKQFNAELKSFLDESLKMPNSSYEMENYVKVPPFSGFDKNGDVLLYGDASVVFVPSITFSKDYEEADNKNMESIILFIQERVKHSTISFVFKNDKHFLCGANSRDIFVEGNNINSFCELNPYSQNS